MASALLILPAAAYLSLLAFAWTRVSIRREALVASSAWFTLALVLLTETLSAGHAITRLGLSAGWIAVLALRLLLGAAVKQASTAKTSGSIPDRAPFSFDLRGNDTWMIAGGVLICLLVGITALVSPPNGSDQLQYHLPRVVEWASRHSVGFFPTHYYVQLFAPPLAEWFMLHSYVLSGGDHFVGLVQWLAYLGSAITASLIAREFGASRRGQILAALLCITLPQGILAASGAKNDWVLAYWMAAAVFFLCRWFRDPSWIAAVNAGISVGAALLSKGSVYAFLPPVVLALALWGLRLHWRAVLKFAPAAVAVVIAMNAAQWSRNYSLGGSIFGMSAPDVAGKDKYSVDRITVPGIASNVLREAAMQFETSSDGWNSRATAAVRSLIRRLGVDPDDHAWTNYSAFEIPRGYYSHDEYYAGNPLHVLLAAVACFLLAYGWKKRQFSPGAGYLFAGLLAGFVFYCALFKWEIWCARLHLPLLVLATAATAVVLSSRLPKLAPALAALALVLALSPALFNQTRPLLFSGGWHNPARAKTSIFVQDRTDLYFTQQLTLRDTYQAAARVIQQARCEDIGIDTSLKPYSHEYPLMALGRNPAQPTRFRYVDVNNLSSKYADGSDRVRPCLVICPDCREQSAKWKEYQPFLPTAQTFGDLVIFRQELPTGVSLSSRIQ